MCPLQKQLQIRFSRTTDPEVAEVHETRLSGSRLAHQSIPNGRTHFYKYETNSNSNTPSDVILIFWKTVLTWSNISYRST